MDKCEGERLYNEVEQEDEDRQSIAQDILGKSTDFLKRIIVPVESQGGVTLSYGMPSFATDSRLKITFADLFWTREEAMQLVVCGLRRPVRLEDLEQSLGHTRQHGPPRSKCYSSTRSAARGLRELDQSMRSSSW